MDYLDKFYSQFENWILKDIKQLLHLEDIYGNQLSPDRNTYADMHRPFVAATILICCAIDVLAAFRYGRDDTNIGYAFKSFIKDYFTKEVTFSRKCYDQVVVYNGLRNALLHGYSLNRNIALFHSDANVHLTKPFGKLLVDVFSLYYDLERAYFKYKSELQNGLHHNEFKKRWLYAPLVVYIPDENLKGSI